MRELTTHHDGYGFYEEIKLVADDVDEKNGNASHLYIATFNGVEILRVQYQHGPRAVAGSTQGIGEAVLLAIVADRMAGFQSGPFAHPINANVKMLVEEAQEQLKIRIEERHKRGVLGTLQV